MTGFLLGFATGTFSEQARIEELRLTDEPADMAMKAALYQSKQQQTHPRTLRTTKKKRRNQSAVFRLLYDTSTVSRVHHQKRSFTLTK
jgi:hypothetical protein